MDKKKLAELAKLVRYYILFMTTKAGSGHPTSSLSATDIMVALFFEKLKFDLKDTQNPNNDRVIFSKGHVSPLIYALYAAAGVLTEEELATYRKFQSPLEGHPRPNFKYVDVATGSLGQGLSVGFGMALAMKPETGNIKQETPRVYVLMGDSEVSEGSVWEACELASYHKLNNLVGIIDVNRLGQSGPTMLGYDVETYKKRVEAFGWEPHVIDGHNFDEILEALEKSAQARDKPQMIIAKTVKGKGVSFLEDKEGWHGKALSAEDFEKAVGELGEVDRLMRGEIAKPDGKSKAKNPKLKTNKDLKIDYKIGEEVATRKAYGTAITKLAGIRDDIVCLDAEVKNSTFAEIFKEKFPDRYFEMFIAEQNMLGAALGFSKSGKVPFASTFAAFLTRAYDQIRMSAYSFGNIKIAGSHAGVSIGEDGPSQMALEDLAMFRAVFGSVVLCPGDAVSCEKLVFEAAKHEGLVYIRTNRPVTPVLYKPSEEFPIGGSKVVKSSKTDKLTIVSCGVTLIESLKAADELGKQGVGVRVIDAYSIKPIDEGGLAQAALETDNTIVTVEDHYPEGGLGDAVLGVFAKDEKVKIYKLAVSKMPMSGKGDELLEYEGISANQIANFIKSILG